MKNTIYMLDSISGDQMNSFIITTSDGHVIIIDGGYAVDAGNLIRRLKEITGQEVPHVDAWFLSHLHSDHMTCFLEIVEKHPGTIDFDHVYYNFPSVQFIYREEAHYDDGMPERFYAALPLFAHKAVIVTARDTFDFGQAHIECLYSPNPELTVNVVNNSSIVLMLSLGGKKILFPGDAGVGEGEKILNFYSGTDKLKADYVQMAHHGQNGVDRSFYEAVSPRGCLWCTPKWLWDNDAGEGYNTHIWKTIAVREWMEELGAAEHYVMMNGLQILEL